MQSKTKINLKIFIPASIILTLVSISFCRNSIEVIVTLGVYLATLANLYMLYQVGDAMRLSVAENNKISKTIIAIFFILKMFIILGSLTLGIHFIGNRIIIAILNYVLQIFALGFSLMQSLRKDK